MFQTQLSVDVFFTKLQHSGGRSVCTAAAPHNTPQYTSCGSGTAERCGSSSSVVFQNYKFNFATENSEQLLSVFVTGSVVMTVILNTTFVLWLTAQSVHCTLLQPGCTKIFNGLDLIQFLVANGTAGDQLHLPFSSAVVCEADP